MKKFRLLIVLLSLSITTHAIARDEIMSYPIADAMLRAPEANTPIEGVAFYFGDHSIPETTTKFDEIKTVRRTNLNTSANVKKDTKSSRLSKTNKRKLACEWAFLAAIQALQNNAKSQSANAVINIKSNWKNTESSSETNYTCAVGNAMVGVALKGIPATIDKK